MAVCVEVWGNYACFSRPEFKTERMSYDVMTPSAARGLLEAIFWHPGLVWRVDRIHVCAPIHFTNLRRNEVKSVMNPRKRYINTHEDIQQRAAMVLQDVHYVIEAHFEMTERAAPGDNPGKFQEMITRRVSRGQCYHQPYFGCREYPVNFKLCREIPPCPDELAGDRDLGWMLYDLNYSDPQNIYPKFFRAVLRNGVMEIPPWNSKEVRG